MSWTNSIPRLNSAVIHGLTKTLILHPIGNYTSHMHTLITHFSSMFSFFTFLKKTAAGLAGFAFFFGICGLANFRVGTVLMTLLAGLALLTTFVAWVIDMILFGIARQRYRNTGEKAQYGNANWLTLGALVALLLAFCASACGVFGRYRRKRDIVYWGNRNRTQSFFSPFLWHAPLDVYYLRGTFFSYHFAFEF